MLGSWVWVAQVVSFVCFGFSAVVHAASCADALGGSAPQGREEPHFIELTNHPNVLTLDLPKEFQASGNNLWKPHELDQALELAKILEDTSSLRVVLVSKIGKSDVPAFDGLVVDQDQQILMNLSLKTAAHADALLWAVKTSLKTIRNFSHEAHWNHFGRDWISYAKPIFGVETDRKTRVVIFAKVKHDDPVMREIQELLDSPNNSKVIESIVVVSPKVAVQLTPNAEKRLQRLPQDFRFPRVSWIPPPKPSESDRVAE